MWGDEEEEEDGGAEGEQPGERKEEQGQKSMQVRAGVGVEVGRV